MKPLKAYEREIAKLLSGSKPRDDNSEVAELIVQARIDHFIRPDGTPDYKGKSYGYRVWFGELLDSLKLGDDRDKVASRIRYSTGNALRRVLTKEQLEDAGLKPISPRDRSSMTYRKISGPYMKLNGPIRSEEDVDLLSNIFIETLDNIRDPHLRKRFLDSIKKHV